MRGYRALGIVALACAGLGGCALDGPSEPAAPVLDREVGGGIGGSRAVVPLASLVVGASGVGVESRTIKVRDTSGVLGRVLAEYERESAAMDAGTRSVWDRCGLRVVILPEAQARELESRLLDESAAMTAAAASDAGTVEHPVLLAGAEEMMVSQGPLWVELVRGPTSARRRTVALHDARVALGPGALRLLARCWAAPAIGGGADDPANPTLGEDAPILIVQLVPQLMDAARRGADDLTPSASNMLATEQGLVFTRLLLTMRLHKGEAAVIVPATPGASWNDAVKSEKALSQTGPGKVVKSGGDEAAAAKDSPAGPVDIAPTGLSDPVPTLGEEMLSVPGGGGVNEKARSSVKRVVVLFAHPPERLDLLSGRR